MSKDMLVIIEKYDKFVNYIYRVVQQIPRRHGTVKDMMTRSIFIQVELLYKALKSDHKSKLHEADANIAVIRYWLRFMADESRALIKYKQHQYASLLLDEVGKMIGAWISGRREIEANG